MANNMATVKLAEIDTKKRRNVRFLVDEDKVKEICASIKSRRKMGLPGLIQPIVVSRAEKGAKIPFILESGFTRFQALTQAAETECQATIQEVGSELDALDLNLQENILRKDLHPVEIVKAVERYYKDYNQKDSEIAARMHCKIEHARNLLRIINSTLVWDQWQADCVARKPTPSMMEVIGCVKAIPANATPAEKEELLNAALLQYKLAAGRRAAKGEPSEPRDPANPDNPPQEKEKFQVRIKDVIEQDKLARQALEFLNEGISVGPLDAGEDTSTAFLEGIIAFIQYLTIGKDYAVLTKESLAEAQSKRAKKAKIAPKKRNKTEA